MRLYITQNICYNGTQSHGNRKDRRPALLRLDRIGIEKKLLVGI